MQQHLEARASRVRMEQKQELSGSQRGSAECS